MSPEAKPGAARQEPEGIKQEDFCPLIGRCCACIPGVTRIVPGEGPVDASVMLVGQNPGADEDKVGRPFVGRSGRYLNKVLDQNHIRRDSLFITSVVKCKTPHNRRPAQEEIANCLPVLLEQIRIIHPELIVLMGQVAWGIPRQDDIRYLETYHPAAAMRFPAIRQKFEADFRKLGYELSLIAKGGSA